MSHLEGFDEFGTDSGLALGISSNNRNFLKKKNHMKVRERNSMGADLIVTCPLFGKLSVNALN